MTDIYKKLIDAFQDQGEERRRINRELALRGGPALQGAPLGAWNIIRSPYLPPNTLAVSDDVWEELRKHCDNRP